jgi:hypothetical protein
MGKKWVMTFQYSIVCRDNSEVLPRIVQKIGVLTNEVGQEQ